MKKLFATLLALILVFSMFALTACGGSEESAEGTQAEGETVQLTDLESMVDVAYMGITEAGEGMYYAGASDLSFAIVLFANPETRETASFVGPCTDNGDGSLTVSDETSGLTLTFSVYQLDDGSWYLDLGEQLGGAVLAECEVSQVLEAMQVINDGGIPVA